MQVLYLLKVTLHPVGFNLNCAVIVGAGAGWNGKKAKVKRYGKSSKKATD